MRTRPRWALLIGLAGLVAMPTSAAAEVTCERTGFDGVFLKVSLDEKFDVASLQVSGQEIQVFDEDVVPLDCTGGGTEDPDVTNTDLVKIRDKSKKSTSVSIADPASFAPGATEAGGDVGIVLINEIEFEIKLGSGKEDRLFLLGDDGANRYRMGREGINPNVEPALPDADIFPQDVERYVVNLFDGEDLLDASGSPETGSALRQPLTFVSGGDGDDELTGGRGRDYFASTDPGDDTVEGGKGDDEIVSGPGADFMSGGPGRDLVNYFRPGDGDALNVSIGADGDNDGSIDDGPPGDRDEVAGSVEDVSVLSGGLINLFGTSAANRLELIGPGAAGSGASGLGGADILLGSDGNDSLVGGSGADRLVGRAGSDSLNAKDGNADKRINCGPGSLDGVSRDGSDPKPTGCEETF